MTDFSAFFNLLIRGPAYLLDIDLKNLEFDNIQIVCIFGAGILLMLLIKLLSILIGRRKHHRKVSGHLTLKNRRVGLVKRLFLYVVPSAVVIPLVAFLMALAGGHKNISSVEYVQTEFRQMMVLFDTSVSIGWESNQPKKAWAEIMRDGYNELLNRRAGKKDRVSLWIFSQTPHLVSDFVDDTDYLKDKIFKAPYVLVDPGMFNRHYSLKAAGDPSDPRPRVILPDEKITQLKDEGGTNLASALREMTDYFDREGDSKHSNTTFLVVTDGAPDTPVDKELQVLRRKKIKLVVLYMYNSTYDHYIGNKGAFGRESAEKTKQAKQFQQDVRKYGGHFYTATNSKELREMYRQIDEQEAVRYNQKVHKDKKDFSENFLRFGVSILFFVILIGLTFSIPKGTSP